MWEEVLPSPGRNGGYPPSVRRGKNTRRAESAHGQGRGGIRCYMRYDYCTVAGWNDGQSWRVECEAVRGLVGRPFERGCDLRARGGCVSGPGSVVPVGVSRPFFFFAREREVRKGIHPAPQKKKNTQSAVCTPQCVSRSLFWGGGGTDIFPARAGEEIGNGPRGNRTRSTYVE